jgi:acetylornithine/succinyldiaminopimelate/putrescine aminotransferase
VVVLEGAFHGRTYGALSATPQESKQAPFAPLVPGVVVVPKDPTALDAAVDSRTAAVLLEPIQGETGINVLSDELLHAAREACDRTGAALVFDEIQCGMGRTGTLWAFEQIGVVPDAMTSAKGLGGGFPIGALITGERLADVFEPGDHGSTLGGNPLACAAGVATLRVLRDEGLLAHTAEVGAYFKDRLQDLSARGAGVKEVRGRGLMLAAEVDAEGSAVVAAMRQRGVLVNSTGPTTIRMVPPLILAHEEVDETIAALEGVLG